MPLNNELGPSIAIRIDTITSDPLSSVCIDVASVSRHHAKIVCSGMRAVIEDVGSKNGTKVGADAVRAARELREGDKIAFVRVDAIYYASDAGVPTVTEGDWSRPG